MTEDGKRKTEDGRRKTEDGRRNVAQAFRLEIPGIRNLNTV